MYIVKILKKILKIFYNNRLRGKTIMNSKKISIILDEFIPNLSFKAILIDGPWGCGKTFEIKNFIKKHKKDKIYYISLFGLESIDEINTALHQLTNGSAIELIKEGISLINKVVKPIQPIANICEALDYQLNNKKIKKVKKNSIIIFDDLERLSKKMDYCDLLGYINSLYLSGCRFICLSSEDNIREANRKEDFTIFKEKVFDCNYKITEANDEVINSLFKPYGLNLNLITYKMFESNLRKAKKTELFYKKILQHIKPERMNIITEKIGLDSLLKAAIYAIDLTFKTYDSSNSTNNKQLYDYYAARFGEQIANGLLYLDKEFKNEIPNFKNIVISLISAFMYLDFSGFDNLVLENIDTNTESSILNEEFYYLSDENKGKYIKEFKKILIEKKHSWNQYYNNLRSILLFGTAKFSENEINIIADDYLENNSNKPKDIKLDLGISENEELSNESIQIIETINYVIEKISREKYVLDAKNILSATDNYYNMAMFIENLSICENEEKKEILNYIIQNEYFFPDISKDIDRNKWNYCHSITKFLNNNNQSQQFIEFAKSRCSQNNSKCQIERFHYLISRYMKKDFTINELINDK